MKSRNFLAQQIEVISPSTANTAFTVEHECDSPPRGMLISRRSSAANLSFLSSTDILATLSCDTASATFTVFFLS